MITPTDDLQIQYPRLSYLPFLLEQLHDFFIPSMINPDGPFHEGWFSFDGLPLKWQLPVGLLYDLFSGASPASLDNTPSPTTNKPRTSSDPKDDAPCEPKLPWRLVVHFTDYPSQQLIPLDAAGKNQQDLFIQNMKEADHLRNGSEAKVMMSLSKEDANTLWSSVRELKLDGFNSIYSKLLNPPGGEQLRHVPIKVYLPATLRHHQGDDQNDGRPRGAIKTVQGLVTPMISSKEPQTVGTALHSLIPTVFPSRRKYIHAQATLHGAVVPPAAQLRELIKSAAYADGFLHVAIQMMNLDG